MKIDIVLATDENFAKWCATTIISVLKNKSEDDEPVFHILGNDLSIKTKERLTSLGENINVIDVDQTDFLPYKEVAKFWTITTLFRIKSASILKNLDKAIYLDCDIIVKGSLADFYNTNIDDFLLAGREDFDSENSKKNLGMSKTATYINAGSILMNLKKWREENAEEKMFNYLKDNVDKLRFMDQDLINYVFQDQIKVVDKKFNYLVPNGFQTKEFKLKWQKDLQDAVVLHFVGWKPWEIYYENVFRDTFWTYWQMTPWHKENPDFYKNHIEKSRKFNSKPSLILNFIKRYPLFIFFKEKRALFATLFK